MKTLKRLVSCLIILSMIASMFLTVTAAEDTTASSERTGITVERMQSADVFGEAVTHTKGYYVTDKRLEALPVTYEAWVYIPSEVYDTAGGVILGTQWDIWSDTWNGGGSSDTHFSFGIRPGGHPTLVYGTNGSKQVWEATGKGVIPADKWTHVVMIHDTREANRFVWCFIDGGGEGGWQTFEKVGQGAGLLELDSTALKNPVFLAGDGISGNSHALDSGIILGDVAVYSDARAASTGEVASDCTNGPDLTDSNLLLYYQISSENQNKDIKDASGHGYDMNFYRTFLTEAEMNEIRAKDKYEYAYSIAFLPDLQYMTNRFPSKLGTIFDYIIDTKEDKNLQYVVGVGDITDRDQQWEWNTVKAQYDLLDAAGIPYTLVRGNHDVYTTDKVMFDETFGQDSAYYKHVAANGGFYDTSSAVNAYVRFEVGSVKYLVLCLDWGIKDTAVLDWVDEVIEAHPDRRVMVTMHAWMNSDGTRFAEGDSCIPSDYNSANIDPQQMWDDCFSKHSNIDMIVCGHMHSDNILVEPATGTNGNLVYQMLIDSQNSDLAVASGGYNGLGLVAYMYFTEDGNHAKIEYYSTTYNRYYYEKNTEISLDFDSYKNFIEADGTPLVPNSSDSAKWTYEDGKLSLNNTGSHSLLRFENELDYNRVEVTMATGTSTYKKSLGATIREGLIFAVSDDGKNYYWVFVTQYNTVEVVKMSDWLFMSTPEKNCGSTAIVNLDTVSFDVDLNEFTLAAEWNDAGNVKIYLNDNLIYDLNDSGTPLTGTGFGLRAVKGAATNNTGTYFTSYTAGVESTSDTPVTPDTPETPVYDNCKDAEGNVLNPYFVNDVIWDNEDGKLFLPEKPGKGLLLFDNKLENNRIEATIVVKDNMGSADGYDGNKRAGLVFALTDYDGDGMFNSTDTDVSYYWAFINNWGCVEVIEMGKYGNWQWLSSSPADINAYGINTDEGVTLAAEWDDEGHIRIFANDQLVQNIVDPTPLTGDLYGMYAVKHWNYAANPSLVNSYYTSFVAGTESETPVKKVEVTVDPTDAGTVTGAGEYYLGSAVTLTATPNEGYSFVGWYNGDTLAFSDATVTFQLAEDLNLTAKFTNVAHTVTVTPGENGTVAGSGSYGEGASATVTATPNAGYKFVGWYNGETKVSTDATYTFTVTGNVDLTAKFDKLTYSVAVDGLGNILNPYFVNGNIWTETDGAIKPAVGTMENFLLFDNALAVNRVEATFRNLPLNKDGNTRNGIVFALTDINGDHITGINDGGANYWFACVSGYGEVQLIGFPGWKNYTTGGGVDVSTDVTLAVEWDAEGNVKVFVNGELRIEKNVGESLTGNLYGVLMRSWANTEDGGYSHKHTLTSFVAGGALATPDTEVNVTVDPTEAGTVTGTGNYYLGQSVTLTATPNTGYTFEGWYENGERVSSSEVFTFTVQANRELTAKFVVEVGKFVYGDANGDNEINMDDVVLLRKYITNFNYATNTSSENVAAGADANADGKINMKDIILLRQYIANYDYETGDSTVVLGPKWDADGELKILAIGNSFSVDAMQYLYQVAQDAGVKKITLGNMYIGGCTLATHLSNAKDNNGAYRYYTNTNGTWTSVEGVSIETAVTSDNWDFITFQQASGYSGMADTYSDLVELMSIVRSLDQNATFAWHMTWAYAEDSTHQHFANYNNDQMTMYNAIVNAVETKILTNNKIDIIIPSGTAIQNTRTSFIEDLTRDGYHLSNVGQYIAAMTYMKALTGISIDNSANRPSDMDSHELTVAIESVNNAIRTPFAVTDSLYPVAPYDDSANVGVIPEGYVQLTASQMGLTAASYYNSADIDIWENTSSAFARGFMATKKFTREELPVGSIIEIAEGWRYRPEGWEYTGTRPDNVTMLRIIIDEEWWGTYTERGFNISQNGHTTSNTVEITLSTDEVANTIFKIIVPESAVQ